MSRQLINADFGKRVVVATADLPWLASPQPGVERQLLDRIGGEVARATSLVRYAPRSVFPAHDHALGEEFLVLDGVFSDEHGDYPAGTYVRNPPGSRHAPRTAAGCTILVKLRQMQSTERERVVIETGKVRWRDAQPAGRSVIELFASPNAGERVTLQRLQPRIWLPAYDGHGGEEIFVISGELTDRLGTYRARTWIRSPNADCQALYSSSGAVLWVKHGHLPPNDERAIEPHA